jgi:hypothetical protein
LHYEMSANDPKRTLLRVYGTKVQLDIASRESIMDSGLRVSAFALSAHSVLRCR